MSQETYNLSDDLKTTLYDLAALSNHKNSKVALSARQVKHHNDVVSHSVAQVQVYIIMNFCMTLCAV